MLRKLMVDAKEILQNSIKPKPKNQLQISINTLSNPLNRRILLFCDAHELACMARVSHYWNTYANSDSVWKNLAGTYFHFPLNETPNSTIEIKKMISRHLQPEKVYERKAVEFQRTHPNIANTIETLPGTIANFFIGITTMDFLDVVTNGRVSEWTQNNSPRIHVPKIGYYAGLFYKAIPAKQQLRTICATVKSALNCKSLRSGRS